MRYYVHMHTQEEILAVWRSHTVRLTKTRTALAQLFAEARAPLSVPDIVRVLCLGGREVNKTTVYRELERMQNIGIIASVHLGDRRQYYELALNDHHHHLVCVRCERVEDIAVDEKNLLAQEARVSCEKNFTSVRHALEFFGVCKMCHSVTT